MNTTKVLSCAVVITAVLALSNSINCAVAAKKNVNASNNWRWSGKVDESVFPRNGVTLHVNPSDARANDSAPNAGSEAAPFRSFPAAVARAKQEMRSQESNYQTVVENATSTQWLRLVRRGNTFAAFTASDRNGTPEVWRPAGAPVQVNMAKRARIGLIVNNGRGISWAQQPKNTVQVEALTLNGQKINPEAWQASTLGTQQLTWPFDSFRANGDALNINGTGSNTVKEDGEDYVDSAYFVHLPLSGDGEITARITGQSLPDNKGLAGITIREDLRPGARKVDVALINGSSVRLGWRRDLPQTGRNVRIVLHPGSHRTTSRADLLNQDEVARTKTLVIEGRGTRGSVVLTASSPAAWASANWEAEDAAKQIYRHALPAGAAPHGLFLSTQDGRQFVIRARADETKELSVGEFAITEGRVLLRLPENLTPRQLLAARVEVAQRKEGILKIEDKDNVVLRNLSFTHSVEVPVQVHWYPEPPQPSRNWLIEDITSRYNVASGGQFDHLTGFTMRRCDFSDNRGDGLNMTSGQGQVLDVTTNRNGSAGWRTAIRNIYARNVQMNDNGGTGHRNDHVAENLLFENCQFNRNGSQSAMFEVAIGPVTFRNCEFSGTRPNTHVESGGLMLSSVHNILIDNCVFRNNVKTAITFYPRERSHNANERGGDNPANNLDIGKWSIFSDTENVPLYLPSRWKPINENRNIIIRNSRFEATGADTMFYKQNYWKRGEQYKRNVTEELRAYNNTYSNPDNPRAFEGPDEARLTFDEWKKISLFPNFEVGSHWGVGDNPQKRFVPTGLPLARSGRNAKAAQIAAGHYRYEAENLPFTSSQPVALLRDAATGSAYHRLMAVQMGDYADYIEYSLNVPEAGDYWLSYRYLQQSGPSEYLGYAQASLNGQPIGSYIDQHSLTKQFMTHQLGQVRLSKGTHKLRFYPVWRNGYGSGDYDLTVDNIELAKALTVRGTPKVAALSSGLDYQLFSGVWDRLPDFSKLTPEKTGQVNNFDLSVAGELKSYAIRFDGFVEVPRDGVYTFYTTVNDGANLYIGDQLVVDNDGIHDGERHEPWQKFGTIALQAGKHPIRVDYFNNAGRGQALEVLYEGPGLEKQVISAGALSNSGL